MGLFMSLGILVARAASAEPLITVNGSSGPITVQPGANVTLSISGSPGHPTDWVGLFLTSGSNVSWTTWQYLNGTTIPPATGQTSATLTFTTPTAPSTYEFRLFASNGYVRLATSAALTVGSGLLVTVNGSSGPITVTARQSLTVSVKGGPAYPGDWVGMYLTNAENTSYLTWKYLNGSTTTPATGQTAGTLTFNAPATAGSYEFRFLVNNMYFVLAESGTLQVVVPATCNATPDDGLPDDAAIQTCLDGGGLVSLAPGTYNIRYGLRIRVSGTILTSANPPAKATFVADPELSEYGAGANTPMLMVATDPATPNNWELSHLTFDGNRFNRNYAWTCGATDYNPGGSNILAKGSGFVIKYVQNINALCGSALEVNGSNFHIYDNTFTGNGFSQGGSPFPYTWADGLTLLRCDGGVVAGNGFAENSDVDLIIGNGQNCTVRFNAIYHNKNYGFAGIQVGGDGSYLTGSVISDNYVQSNLNLLSIGMAVGAHPWNSGHHTWDAGNIEANIVTGAVINVLVDGVNAGRIAGNSIWTHQGDRGYAGCGLYFDYVVGSVPYHIGAGLVLQPGYTPILSFDDGVCLP